MSATGDRRRAAICRGDGWLAATWPIAPALRPFVRRIEGYWERLGRPLVRAEHAVPYVPVLLELGPSIRVSAAGERFRSGFAAGLGERSTLTAHDGFQTGIELNLAPAGARRLFRRPLREVAGTCVALEELLEKEDLAGLAPLRGLDDWDARLALVERLVVRALAREAAPGAPGEVVAWACRRLEADGGRGGITALVRETGYSPKHLVTLFEDHVGVAPKVFARIVRLDRLVRRLRRGERIAWAAEAVELGFFDQAHLGREVKRMTGLTPTALAASLGAGGFVPDLISLQDARDGGT